jgi:lipid-A-disaccharide synthase
MGRESMHKELIQKEVTVQNLLNEYNSIDKKQFLDNSKILRDYLKNGSSKIVADIINDK